jgi:HEAT repeat protein
MSLVRKPHQGPPSAGERRTKTRTRADLLEGLVHPDPLVRRWSARDLRDEDEVSDALVAQLRRETDPSVREIIVTTLIVKADRTAVDGLAGLLRSEDPAVRNEAVVGLQQMPDEVAPILEGLLVDPDPDVRILTVKVLESLRHPRVEDWLIQVLETDAHVNVCATALDLIVEAGTPRALGAVAAVKARFPHEPYIQYVAQLAEGRLLEP